MGTLLTIISSLILTETDKEENYFFFYQKHGLTPLEKFSFLGLSLFLVLFLTKNK